MRLLATNSELLLLACSFSDMPEDFTSTDNKDN